MAMTALKPVLSETAMNQPLNASSLAAMRAVRKVPPLPILVSLVGPLEFSNLTLHAKAGEPFDWNVVRALEVELFSSKDIPSAKLVKTLADIAAVVPARMILTFLEGPRIECGEKRRICDDAGDFELFDWFPISIGPYGYRGAQIIEKWLWKAIANGDIPTPYDRARELVVQIALEKNQ